MSIVKSYTDLPQSKRLSEILSHESADMWYREECGLIIPELGMMPKKHVTTEVPCWSLAALLNVVSKEVSLNSFKDGNWNAMVQQNGKVIYGDANNSVDACVEMIEKLHKQKLL